MTKTALGASSFSDVPTTAHLPFAAEVATLVAQALLMLHFAVAVSGYFLPLRSQTAAQHRSPASLPGQSTTLNRFYLHTQKQRFTAAVPAQPRCRCFWFKNKLTNPNEPDVLEITKQLTSVQTPTTRTASWTSQGPPLIPPAMH